LIIQTRKAYLMCFLIYHAIQLWRRTSKPVRTLKLVWKLAPIGILGMDIDSIIPCIFADLGKELDWFLSVSTSLLSIQKKIIGGSSHLSTRFRVAISSGFPVDMGMP